MLWRKSRDDEELRKFDPYVHGVTVVPSPHRIIHDGFAYMSSGKQTGWLTSTTKTFLINVPADTRPHVQTMLMAFGSGDIDFVAYEGATTSDDGAPLITVNVNRNSTNTADTTLFAEPTITDNGTEIYNLWAPPTGAGVGQSANGVTDVGQGNEWVLAPSTKYLVILTNNSGNTIAWSYEFMFYEVGYVD